MAQGLLFSGTGTVTLGSALNVGTDGLSFAGGSSITLDQGGFTLSSMGSTNFTNAVTINNVGPLAVAGGTTFNTGAIASFGAVSVGGAGDLTLSGSLSAAGLPRK